MISASEVSPRADAGRHWAPLTVSLPVRCVRDSIGRRERKRTDDVKRFILLRVLFRPTITIVTTFGIL